MSERESPRRWSQKVNKRLIHEGPVGHYLKFDYYSEQTRIHFYCFEQRSDMI